MATSDQPLDVTMAARFTGTDADTHTGSDADNVQPGLCPRPGHCRCGLTDYVHHRTGGLDHGHHGTRRGIGHGPL
jgi:hypothetical protein